jgi:PHP family Zn ribbon phosphoesterase
MTGLTKIAGVFSTLNNLDELTTKEKYATMLGYTGEELETYFDNYLREGATKLNITREELLERIRDIHQSIAYSHQTNPNTPRLTPRT